MDDPGDLSDPVVLTGVLTFTTALLSFITCAILLLCYLLRSVRVLFQPLIFEMGLGIDIRLGRVDLNEYDSGHHWLGASQIFLYGDPNPEIIASMLRYNPAKFMRTYSD